MTTMTRTTESTASPFTSSSPTLFLAFDLGDRSWTLGFSTGLEQRPRLRKVAAGATERGSTSCRTGFPSSRAWSRRTEERRSAI